MGWENPLNDLCVSQPVYYVQLSIWFASLYVVSVNGFPVVLHGYGNPAIFIAGIGHFLCGLWTAQLTVTVITDNAEGQCLILIIKYRIVQHAGVTGGITKA